MKALKIIGKILLWTFVVVLVLLLALPLWIGPVVKGVANKVTPDIVGTDFHLGKFALNHYVGRLQVGDLQLANPTNFSKENCVELKDLKVKLDMGTLTDKKIVIEEIAVDGLRIATTLKGDNFKQIAKNAAGPESDKTAVITPAEFSEATTGEASAEKSEAPGVQINRIIITNLTVQYGSLPVPIPTIEILDLGKDSEDGVTVEEVAVLIYTTVMKSVGAVGDFGKAIGSGAIDVSAAAAGAATDLTKSLGADAIKIEKETVDSVINLFKRDKKK